MGEYAVFVDRVNDGVLISAYESYTDGDEDTGFFSERPVRQIRVPDMAQARRWIEDRFGPVAYIGIDQYCPANRIAWCVVEAEAVKS